MTKLELTDTHRLILANQFEILGILKKDEGYTRLADQLREGHEWLYQQSLEYLSPNLLKEDAELVLTILGIYSDIRESYEKLEDKSGITPQEVVFPGFDGNNEGELLRFSRALRASDHFVDVITARGKNSHMPTREIYARIIGAWRTMGEPRYPLTRQQIMQLLAARTHPSNR